MSAFAYLVSNFARISRKIKVRGRRGVGRRRGRRGLRNRVPTINETPDTSFRIRCGGRELFSSPSLSYPPSLFFVYVRSLRLLFINSRDQNFRHFRAKRLIIPTTIPKEMEVGRGGGRKMTEEIGMYSLRSKNLNNSHHSRNKHQNQDLSGTEIRSQNPRLIQLSYQVRPNATHKA